MFDVPILYIVFNRPKETALSFEVLKKIKPSKLYVAADGPRSGNHADLENTKKVRDIIAGIDWECDFKTLFREQNLGCRKAVESCLEWFFSNEEQGIILEDDIIPNDGFFEFAQIMLDRFKDDPGVFSINGCSLGYQNQEVPYGRTNYFNMWGWATWRRSFESVQPTWEKFNADAPLESDVSVKKNLRLPVLFDGNDTWLKYWERLFRDVRNYKIDTWDYQWCFSALHNNQYCIRPSENFIVNIGNGDQATHHKFNEAPIFNFVYTAGHYTDKEIINPKTDFDYELYHVAAIVNSHYFKSFRKRYILSYLRYKLENIKSKFGKKTNR